MSMLSKLLIAAIAGALPHTTLNGLLPVTRQQQQKAVRKIHEADVHRILAAQAKRERKAARRAGK